MRILALSCMLLLAGCTSLSTKERTLFGDTNTSLSGQIVPGISDLDTITKDDKEDAKWWDGFYGHKASE